MVLGSQLSAVKPWQLGTVPLTSASPELRLLLGTSVGSLLFVRAVKESVPPYKGNRKAPSHMAGGLEGHNRGHCFPGFAFFLPACIWSISSSFRFYLDSMSSRMGRKKMICFQISQICEFPNEKGPKSPHVESRGSGSLLFGQSLVSLSCPFTWT